MLSAEHQFGEIITGGRLTDEVTIDGDPETVNEALDGVVTNEMLDGVSTNQKRFTVRTTRREVGTITPSFG